MRSKMILETKRLILREWNLDDVDDLVEGLNNIEVSKWLGFVPYPYTKKDAEDWINSCIDDKENYKFAIELKENHKVIGGTSLERINKIQGTAGGGIWTNASYHGKGYGSEAWRRRIEFAFEELDLRRLETGFFDGNIPSFKMQTRFGGKIEGLKRKAYLCIADNTYKDEYIVGLLKEEWSK